MELYHYVGIAGVALYLTAYALLQLGLLRGSDYRYTLMNMAAAACVLISLIDEFNLSSFLIQVSWIAISIVGLARMAFHARMLKFTAAEVELATSALPGLPRIELRRLLNQGRWATHFAGTTLARQGEQVSDLIYVASGRATVLRDGAQIAEISEGSFIGEITCLTGAPATATVVVSGRMRCFRIPAETLRSHVQGRPGTLEHLERAFGADLRRKLERSGERVVGMGSAAQIPA